jgi:hypothetical protein
MSLWLPWIRCFQDSRKNNFTFLWTDPFMLRYRSMNSRARPSIPQALRSQPVFLFRQIELALAFVDKAEFVALLSVQRVIDHIDSRQGTTEEKKKGKDRNNAQFHGYTRR